ncbi:MAG: DUF4976 domain-containing protein, partial [Saprospiraceae bacterium]|nr:DUF4976 domain-containing protein [Saprospiraceae bacterium]
ITFHSFVRGKSFRRALLGESDPDWRKSLYYRYWLHRSERPAHFGIRTDRHKLAFFYGQPLDMPGAMSESTKPAWEFYDLETDPFEARNAYHDTTYSAIIDSLKTELIKLRDGWKDTDDRYPTMQEIIKANW